MTDTVRQAAAPSPSPRHMRKRRFLGDVPTSTLPGNPGTVDIARSESRLSASPKPARPAGGGTAPKPTASSVPSISTGSRKASPRQKRLVALTIVILVSISIPLLVLTLMFAG